MAGQGAKPKRLAAWKWVLLPWMAAVILLAYLWAGDLPAFQNPEAARIIFWHVPMAILSMVWFILAALVSVRYLVAGRASDDTRAAEAAGIGLLLTLLATLTGAVFSKMQWAGGFNSPWYEGYWQWDPQQTSITIVILYFMAYFGLRLSIEDARTRARLSAAYAVLGGIAVPLLYFVVPRLPIFGNTIHPSNVIRSGMDTPYRVTFWMAVAGFGALTVWVYSLRLRLAALAERAPQVGVAEVRTQAVRTRGGDTAEPQQ